MMKKIITAVVVATSCSQVFAFNIMQSLTNMVSGNNQQQNQQYQQQYPNQGYQQYPNQGYQQYQQQGYYPQQNYQRQQYQAYQQSNQSDIYQKTYDMLMSGSQGIDAELSRSGINFQACNLNSFAKFDVSVKEFNQDTGSSLPKSPQPYGAFSVDTVANLNKAINKKSNLVVVSIPSVEVMETVTGFPASDNMKQNWTGMLIPRSLLDSWNQEVAMRNININTSKNLKDYTFRMLSALSSTISKTQYIGQLNTFGQNSMTLYARDLIGCTFDAKP